MQDGRQSKTQIVYNMSILFRVVKTIEYSIKTKHYMNDTTVFLRSKSF